MSFKIESKSDYICRIAGDVAGEAVAPWGEELESAN